MAAFALAQLYMKTCRAVMFIWVCMEPIETVLGHDFIESTTPSHVHHTITWPFTSPVPVDDVFIIYNNNDMIIFVFDIVVFR